MSSTAEKFDRKYSYADYLKWPDEERFELIEGIVYDMSPAPSPQHQNLLFEIAGLLYNFLKDRRCRAFPAPFDVRFPEKGDTSDSSLFNVVQPDITVVCDPEKIDDRGCLGAPDLIIEILSPSTAFKDETEKMMLYEKHGVGEYWLVNPVAKYIVVYRHNGTGFDKPDYYKENDLLESATLCGLTIDLKELWERSIA